MKTSRIIIAIGLAGFLGMIALIWWAQRNHQRRVEWEKAKEAHEQHVNDSLADVQAKKTAALNKWMRSCDSLIVARRFDVALKLCDSALELDNGFAGARLRKGHIFRARKKYPEAIEEYTKAIRMNAKEGTAWYDRAICYSAQNKKQEAVADLRQAMNLNYPGAEKMYNKINPEKRRVTGSHCVCCDGSISYSSGRGTCSHHGGVCGTQYEYETYREY